MRLFERFPGLATHVAWTPIGDWPTPVLPLRTFGAVHGLPSLYVKREDLSHRVAGGNKVRGLEFLLAEAERRGAKTILTLGAAGSHHVFTTAWHARQRGMDTVALLVPQPAAEYVRRNLTAGLAIGTRYVPTGYVALPARLAWEWRRIRHKSQEQEAAENFKSGVYFVPPGGTNPLACLGHVNAGLELADQIARGDVPAPDHLCVSLGSLGTAAGLLVGCRLAGLRCRLVGIVTYSRWFCTAGRWAALARRVLRLMQRADATVPNIDIRRRDVEVVACALGRGYACATNESRLAASEMLAQEGLPLDGTYTAKTVAGMLDHLRRIEPQHETVLYWHTYQDRPKPVEPLPDNNRLPSSLSRYFATGEQTQT